MLISNVSFPNANHLISASNKIFILSCISFLLRFLPICQWLKSRMAMPIFSVDLKNDIANRKVDIKIRFDTFLKFIFHSNKLKHLPTLYFWSRTMRYKSAFYRTKYSLRHSDSCQLAFMNFKYFSTLNAYSFDKIFRTSTCWLELSGCVLRNTLHRAIARITVSPVHKMFPAPLANKYRMLRRIVGLVIAIRTCLRAELSTCAHLENMKFFSTCKAFYYRVLRFYSAFSRAINWNFSMYPSELIGKFLSAFNTYFCMIYTFPVAFHRAKSWDVSRPPVTIMKLFSAIFANKIIFRGLNSHRTVSCIVHSWLKKWARRQESGACQRFMMPFKPNTIIAQSIAGGG